MTLINLLPGRETTFTWYLRHTVSKSCERPYTVQSGKKCNHDAKFSAIETSFLIDLPSSVSLVPKSLGEKMCKCRHQQAIFERTSADLTSGTQQLQTSADSHLRTNTYGSHKPRVSLTTPPSHGNCHSLRDRHSPSIRRCTHELHKNKPKGRQPKTF